MLVELKEILPVPFSPLDVDESVLKENVTALKTEFPNDFLEYSREYGSGQVSVRSYAWEIWSAFRPSYPEFVSSFHDDMSDLRDGLDTHDVPLGLYPEPGGLLPFAARDAVYFTWKTIGRPDDWYVVVMWSYEQNTYESFEMNFSQFLVALLKRRIELPIYPTKWNPETDITFTPEVYSG